MVERQGRAIRKNARRQHYERQEPEERGLARRQRATEPAGERGDENHDDRIERNEEGGGHARSRQPAVAARMPSGRSAAEMRQKEPRRCSCQSRNVTK